MPRRARCYLPGYPYHIVQRGNNREVCFIEPENYQFYLELWQQLSERYHVSVHAYCLMTNHIHILATPDEDDSVSLTMKAVGSRYAQYTIRNITAREPCGKASLQSGSIFTLLLDLSAVYRTQPGSGRYGGV